jgi:hypothetical protein
MFTTIKSKFKEFGEKISDGAAEIGGKLSSIDPNDIVVIFAIFPTTFAEK